MFSRSYCADQTRRVLTYIKGNEHLIPYVTFPAELHPERCDFTVTVTAGNNEGLVVSVSCSLDTGVSRVETILITKDGEMLDNTVSRHDLRTGTSFPHLLQYLRDIGTGKKGPSDYSEYD